MQGTVFVRIQKFKMLELLVNALPFGKFPTVTLLWEDTCSEAEVGDWWEYGFLLIVLYMYTCRFSVSGNGPRALSKPVKREHMIWGRISPSSGDAITNPRPDLPHHSLNAVTITLFCVTAKACCGEGFSIILFTVSRRNEVWFSYDSKNQTKQSWIGLGSSPNHEKWPQKWPKNPTRMKNGML